MQDVRCSSGDLVMDDPPIICRRRDSFVVEGLPTGVLDPSHASHDQGQSSAAAVTDRVWADIGDEHAIASGSVISPNNERIRKTTPRPRLKKLSPPPGSGFTSKSEEDRVQADPERDISTKRVGRAKIPITLSPVTTATTAAGTKVRRVTSIPPPAFAHPQSGPGLLPTEDSYLLALSSFARIQHQSVTIPFSENADEERGCHLDRFSRTPTA